MMTASVDRRWSERSGAVDECHIQNQTDRASLMSVDTDTSMEPQCSAEKGAEHEPCSDTGSETEQVHREWLL